jgi:hypothetical protein
MKPKYSTTELFVIIMKTNYSNLIMYTEDVYDDKQRAEWAVQKLNNPGSMCPEGLVDYTVMSLAEYINVAKQEARKLGQEDTNSITREY